MIQVLLSFSADLRFGLIKVLNIYALKKNSSAIGIRITVGIIPIE